jgi:hypothetical protein
MVYVDFSREMMNKKSESKILIWGSYYNAITVSLHFKSELCLFVDSSRLLVKKDSFIQCDKILTSVMALLNEFKDHNIYVIPCSDSWAEILALCIESFPEMKFLLSKNFSILSEKPYQKTLSDSVGGFYPKSVLLNQYVEGELSYPIIIKPIETETIPGTRKKNIIINDADEYQEVNLHYSNLFDQLLASEIVVSAIDGIYSFACLKLNGKVLNSWTGKKNIQYPNAFGVFASAETIEDPELYDKGLALANEVDYEGFIQPEFKKCLQTGEYMLMEINFRPMMWHATVLLNGVNIYDGFVPKSLLSEEKFAFSKLMFFPHVLFLLVFGTKIERKIAWGVINGNYNDISFNSADKFLYIKNLIKVVISGVIKKVS